MLQYGHQEKKKKNEFTSINLNTNSSTGLFVSIDTSGLILHDPTTDSDIGITGINAAKKSREILIKNEIPFSNIMQFYESEQVTRDIYDKWDGGKYTGSRKNKSQKLFVIWKEINETPDNYLEYLKKAAMEGLKSRFIIKSDISEEIKRIKKRSLDTKDKKTTKRTKTKMSSTRATIGAGKKKPKKKADGGMIESNKISQERKKVSQFNKGGIARGCGAVKEKKRKKTKFR